MWVGGPCQPRASTGRKPQTSSGSQTTACPHTVEYQCHGATCYPDPLPTTAARQRDMLTARPLNNPRHDPARAAGPSAWPPPAATG